MEERIKYFVTDRRCGLGDVLLNLAATWWLAKEFKRSVIVDWSKLPYAVLNWGRDGGNFHRHSINLFPSLFRPPAPLEGVAFEQPEQFRELFFDEWNHALKDVNELPLIKPDTPFTTLEKELAEEKIIRVGGWWWGEHSYFPKLKEFDFVSFFNHLKLQSVIQDKLSVFKEEHFSSKKIVGLHLRHGSGESDPNQPRASRRKRGAQNVRAYVEAALKTVESQVSALNEYAVFVCTDDGDCEEVALDLFPNSFSFPKALPRESDCQSLQQQALHCNPAMNAVDSIQDSLIDLILLSECEIFAGSKSSAFNCLARAKKWAAGTGHTIIDLDNIVYNTTVNGR